MRPSRANGLATIVAASSVACSNAATMQRATGAPTLTAADTAFVDTLSKRTFEFFWQTTNPRNGLAPDRWPSKSFSSVAATGFALTAYPVGVERGWVGRDSARVRVLTTLRFFWQSAQGRQSDRVTGYKGFYYHFLDMETGYRFEHVELSTIDTALLLAGALTCQQYFNGNDPAEREIRALTDSLYGRVDWQWARDSGITVNMGWRPEAAPYQNARGFNISSWRGYDEGMILYILALGSPTHPVDPEAWTEWTKTYKWDRFQGYELVQFAPLFGHQYSQIWIDFRGVRDAYMRGKGIDYFENSRRAVLSQREYAEANPNKWRGYDADVWGLSASDGPLDSTLTVGGQRRQFHTYWARGAAAGETRDDGTIAPTAAGGSIAFAPTVVVPALRVMRARYGAPLFAQYGFVDAFNPTLLATGAPLHHGHIIDRLAWFDTDYLGIDQGPILAMAENWRTGMIWRLLRDNRHVVRGMCRAGFDGGWLAGRC
ncbi:MAG TPA: glucoamylase family protein [Gemmatimonadaceae bacterium]|jgi:hypothetical protein